MGSLKFKAWMAENNVRQADLKVLLGISTASVWKKVNGREPFTVPQISKICNTYGISADIFIPKQLQKYNAESDI